MLGTTTSALALFAGRDDLGAVVVGKRADPMLLRKNPTHSVVALRDVVAVVRDGTYRFEDDLAAVKDRIAREHTAG